MGKMKMKNKDDCKGCLGIREIGECNLLTLSLIVVDSCPCRQCLVKVMCKSDCDPFTQWLYGEIKDE
jgi:hypothetical protein